MSTRDAERDAADTRFMSAAIAYARRGLGVTAPNPAVGSIIVKDGVIIGRGATQPGGRPHAETVALADAAEAARGATLYVTLEPCSHHGVTGPCAHAIVKAGVTRVVSAIEDPDPRVAGKGHAILREAGIDVRVGVGAEAARRGNLGHILRVAQGRPMVTLKLAETADGFAAGAGAHDARLMITGQAANNRVQIMRALHDAIMIGAGTALGDDPLLTVRLPGLGKRSPLRVVLDTHLRLPLRSRLVATAGERPVLVIAGEGASATARMALEDQGVMVEIAPLGANGHIDLPSALSLLAQRGVTRVFSEGGPLVAAALIEAGLVDDVFIIRGEKPFGRPGLPALDPVSRARLADPLRFRAVDPVQLGADRLAHYERIL
jgi:diaminohydroxyphosphoribosylaminopyrimidine deaminase/5-amino-6-(5-phosphoribosylamino)uracil reductase